MITTSRWELVPLGDIVENKDLKRVPIKESDRTERHGIYPYYGASGIIDYVDGYLFKGVHLLIGEDGANLLARLTPIAFIADGKFWVNNHAHVLGATERVELKYLAYFFETLDLKPYITGSAQPKLTRKSLDRILVPLPSIAEQKRIAAILDEAEELRGLRRKALGALDAIAPGDRTERLYLLNLLRTTDTQRWISRQVKGATFREITLARLRELPVLVPPLSLQQEFARRVEAIEQLKTTHRESLAQLDALFDSLQHRAFRGEL